MFEVKYMYISHVKHFSCDIYFSVKQFSSNYHLTDKQNHFMKFSLKVPWYSTFHFVAYCSSFVKRNIETHKTALIKLSYSLYIMYHRYFEASWPAPVSYPGFQIQYWLPLKINHLQNCYWVQKHTWYAVRAYCIVFRNISDFCRFEFSKMRMYL